MTSPYETARAQGYSDEEIMSHLEKHPKYSDKIKTARDQGYSNEEISKFLSTYSPKQKIEKKHEKSNLEKGGRIAGQFALGAAENIALPYELAVAPLGSKEAQHQVYRENVFEDIERLQEQKAMGQWDEQDQKLYDHLVDQIKHPEKAMENVKTADLGVRGLAEKATGIDLHPEGIAEKAASWAGFLKDPKKLTQLAKSGSKVSDIIKAISPTGKEAMRGLGAGMALQMAEDGNYGPIGTMAAAVVGDVMGAGAAGALKGAAKLITKPKQTLAKAVAKFTPKEKLELQKDIINSLKENEIQANLGTITGNKAIQGMEAKLMQSSLSGEAPEQLKKAMSDQIKSEYKVVADSLGEARFQTLHEAGEVGKEAVTHARDFDKKIHTELYEKARNRLNEGSTVRAANIARAINRIEHDLSMGSLKSPEQKKVLDALQTIKSDITESSGKIKDANVQSLMNNKIALNDIIDYEIQGGQKQLLKSIVKEIDKSIMSYGEKDKEFLKNFSQAEKKFADHAKTYRNENINRILTAKDPMTIMNKMNTVQGIRDMKTALSKTPEGKAIFNDLARAKFDQLVGNKMADNISEQVKTGKFANLIQNPKNAQIVKELLPPDAYKRLQNLMKNSGKLTEVAQKFFNASKTGSSLLDTALVGNAMLKIGAMFSGNPWPFTKAVGAYLTVSSLSKLIYDPKFLRLVEDAILASDKNNTASLMNIGKSMEEIIKQSIPAASIQGKQAENQ